MDKFIWIGPHVVNLDRIVRFTVEDDDRRIRVLLAGVREEHEIIVVDGPDAEALLPILQTVELGKPATEPVPPGCIVIPTMQRSHPATESDVVQIIETPAE